ncbi:MAG: M20 family metallopeptidase [Candidatus Baldrarchaeia archaeon]
MEKEILKVIEQKEREVASLCSELIKRKSENPPGDVSEAAFFVRDLLKEWGLDVKTVEPERGRVNVVAILKGHGEKKLLFNGHLDVVPAGDPKNWKYDPYEGRISGGIVYGRGACDMKGAIASMLTTLSVILEKDVKLGGDLIFHFVCDEETGGQFGTGYLAREGYVSADGCIIGEGSGNSVLGYTLVVAERGVIWAKIKAKGRAAHGSVPMLGDNAILKLMRVIDVIRTLSDMELRIDPEIERLAESSMEYLGPFMRAYKIDPEDFKRNMLRMSVNVGVVRGGTKVNVVPEYAEAEIDVRVPPSVSLEEAISLLRDRIKSMGVTGVELELMATSEPSYQDVSHPFVNFVRRCVEEVTGRSVPLIMMPWSTDARYIRNLGIPTVMLGPLNESPHMANEYVPIRDLVMCAKMYALIALRFLGHEA